MAVNFTAGIAGRRDVQAELHPVDIVVERYSRDLRWVWLVDVEWRQLRGGKNEVLAFFKQCLKAPPELPVGGLGAGNIRAPQPPPFLDFTFQTPLASVPLHSQP